MAILIYLLWFLFLGLFSIIFLKKNKNSTSNLRHLPGPRGLPIIGNLHRSKGVLHRWFHQLSLKYGPVMVLRLGSTPIVLISASEAAEEVLKTKDLETCNRPKTVGTGKLSYNYKDISFSQYTDSWRDNRKVTVMELLNPKKIRTFNFIREEETAFMVNKLSESALKQSPVDISNICFCLTANILCRAALGQNLRTNKFFDEKRIEELVTQGMVTAGGFGFSDFIPGRLGKFADWLLQTHKGIEKVLKELDEFYHHVIDDHLRSLELDGRQTTDPPAHIVSGLLAMVNKHGDASKRNLDQVKGTLMDIFIAGIDTGVATMIWTVTELIRNPRVMKKAQEEIRAVLGNKREKITDEDTEKVEYLKLILKETFRLHPVVPNLPRESVSHIKIQGYDIPPNTQIQINVWAIGQDPKIWKNPEEFIPERFLDNPIHYKGQNYGLLPFGSGRRMCPGMPMAIPTLELGLLNMLYFFDWKLPEGMVSEDINMDEVGNISSAKKEPLILVPVQHH